MNHATKAKQATCTQPMRAYPNDEQRATIESHCADEGVSISGFLIREGLRAAAVYQQIKRDASKLQEAVTGMRGIGSLEFAAIRAQSTSMPTGVEGGFYGVRRGGCGRSVPASRGNGFMVRRDPPCVRKAAPAASRGVSTVPRLRL